MKAELCQKENCGVTPCFSDNFYFYVNTPRSWRGDAL